MDIQTLYQFFKWCTILNGSLLILSVVGLLVLPNLTYRIQSFWMPLPREKWDQSMYNFLGLYKILILVFNAVPWVALSIIA